MDRRRWVSPPPPHISKWICAPATGWQQKFSSSHGTKETMSILMTSTLPFSFLKRTLTYQESPERLCCLDRSTMFSSQSMARCHLEFFFWPPPATGNQRLLQRWRMIGWREPRNHPLNYVPLHFAITLRRTTRETSLGQAIIYQLLGIISGVEPGDLEDFIEKHENKCLILLDGFDEYRGSTELANSLSAIMGFRRNRRLRVLVTSMQASSWRGLQRRRPIAVLH